VRPFPRPRPAELVAVAALLVLGTTLRFWRLDLGWFGVDQARDIQTALDIAAGRDWPTVGPTMRRVTSLGALYYYVWALPHLVSDDPLAAYRFAAVLGVLALAGTWAFARRAWGARAALVSLAVLATARIAVIDGRVAWAPAALPAMAVLLLWLLAGPVTAGRMAALGAALGVAVQLHLAMVAGALAAVALVLLQRPGRRALAAGTVGALVTGSPALYAALANAGRDAGIATLPSRGPLPNLLTRASAVASLEWHVPSAFWQWPDASEPAVLVSRGAAVLIAIAAALGIGRLVAAIRHGERPAIVVSTILVCQLAMVALLPGETWYYYLDPMLPLVALAAGALVGETAAARPRPVLTVLAASVIVAALWLGGQSGRWLAASAHHGYLAVDPSALTLDGHGGRDAAAPGRLLSLGAKRAVATVLADEPADFATRWRATHGPAFDDVTGDNGFWLARVSSGASIPVGAVAPRGALVPRRPGRADARDAGVRARRPRAAPPRALRAGDRLRSLPRGEWSRRRPGARGACAAALRRRHHRAFAGPSRADRVRAPPGKRCDARRRGGHDRDGRVAGRLGNAQSRGRDEHALHRRRRFSGAIHRRDRAAVGHCRRPRPLRTTRSGVSPQNCTVKSGGAISARIMSSAPDLDARALAALYDEGYYHGVNSGYPAAGYESEHATWQHWVEHLAARTPPGARWLDLGCAYGYLVAEAATGGFAAVGVDVSAYALARARHEAPGSGGRVLRGITDRLPFADASFDVVSAFDVLEHVRDPERTLAEVARVCKPGGVLIGATPDPLFFGRHEETHFSERPPSYWIDRLLALGFAVDFRFFQADYNLELLAVRAATSALVPAGALRPEGFGAGATLGSVIGSGAEQVAIRLRSGFVAAPVDGAPEAYWSAAGDGLCYLLVAGREPRRITLRVEACAERAGELVVDLGDQEIGRVAIAETPSVLTLPSVPVPAGGHRLRLRADTPLLVRRLEVAAEPVTRVELLSRLPFDMYQRYDHARAATARLGTSPRRVLDVGGVMGGARGHFASLADFFPDDRTVAIDVRGADHPDHLAVAGPPLPFDDASFDLVLCQDVLEHVPPDGRSILLDELRRVSRRFVVLGAPFATPGVRDADAVLFALVQARHGYEHGFLQEHLTHGHPDLDATIAHYEAGGASVVVLPNGYLPYWSLMQAANLLLAEPALGARYARGQSRYNGQVADWREPAYRHLVIVDLTGGTDWQREVRRLVTNDADADAAARRLRDARALDEVLTLATTSVGPAAVARAPVAPAVVAPSALARSAGAFAADPAPASRAEPRPDPGEQARIDEAVRFAAEMRAHPLYRVYAGLRHLVRQLAGNGRA
jgi:SAM-dependent methyltransferase